MWTDKDKSVIFVVGMLSVTIALAAYLLPEEAVRVWFVISFLAMPVLYWAGYRIGTKESRSHLSGMQAGVSTVTSAADKLNTRKRGEPFPIVGWEKPAALPRPQITAVAGSTDDVIDL